MMPQRNFAAEERPVSLLETAVAKIKGGNKAAARDLLKQICKSDPKNVSAWLWRASAAETPLEAVSHLEQVLRISPKNPTALAWVSAIREAAAHCEPATAPPVEPPKPQRRGCLFCQHQFEPALSRCPACRALNEPDVEGLLRNQGVDEARVRPALERLRAAAPLESGFEAKLALALACLNLRHWAEGLEWLQKAAELRPNHASVANAIAAISRLPLVMIVDDSATIRTVISKSLEREAFRTLSLANGMEALSALEEHRPDLVLLDVTMPYIDGYQICKAIKNHPRTRGVPVVMLSGNDGFFDKVKGRMAGAETYLTKPCEPPVLLKCIREYLDVR